MALNFSAGTPAGRLLYFFFFYYKKKRTFFCVSSSCSSFFLPFHRTHAVRILHAPDKKNVQNTGRKKKFTEKNSRDKFETLKKHWFLRVQSISIQKNESQGIENEGQIKKKKNHRL